MRAPDEGFLARMMRPTASSASKVHGKTEVASPPRPKVARRQPSKLGMHPPMHADTVAEAPGAVGEKAVASNLHPAGAESKELFEDKIQQSAQKSLDEPETKGAYGSFETEANVQQKLDDSLEQSPGARSGRSTEATLISDID